jgi:hypothetical protein
VFSKKAQLMQSRTPAIKPMMQAPAVLTKLRRPRIIRPHLERQTLIGKA